MSRPRALIVLSLLFGASGIGQQIHSVAPDTKNNRVELTIANQASLLTGNLEIKADRYPSCVTFSPTVQVLDSIAPGKEGAVVFSFDVARLAQVNRRDTLEFRISEKSGAVWMKSIIVQYVAPTTFALDQNFPNPFNPTTQIQCQLPVDSRVSLKVYDVLGREVAMLMNDVRPAGYHDVQWDAGNVASGVYFYRIEAQRLTGGSGFQQIKKMLVLK